MTVVWPAPFGSHNQPLPQTPCCWSTQLLWRAEDTSFTVLEVPPYSCISGWSTYFVLKNFPLCWHKPSLHSFSRFFVDGGKVLSACMDNSKVWVLTWVSERTHKRKSICLQPAWLHLTTLKLTFSKYSGRVNTQWDSAGSERRKSTICTGVSHGTKRCVKKL